ncbi:protein pemK [Asticcacaulis biprosthecium C19]|uniref:Protein pemK n=1 Tax=Asticcacaulis biprosthecium C19 TaxID=715226 RepID=F4QT31_9CAUL|nr:type II toxin-antitoxin system PemK/MazF family toxin [Asticcacaulis biprosthecium]EGF89901.1 protein pemK [Asticcacaulis biprosthecium C19]
MVKAQRPRRGDIYHLDFTPSAGKEMVGKHFAFIISPEGYNTRGLAYVAPISTGGNLARSEGLAVSLTGAGTKTTGVIDLTQIRAVDLAARSGKFVETAPGAINDEVFARIYPIFTDDE